MRIFVKYNSDGEILSVLKVDCMPEGLEQPYGALQGDEDVIEIPESEDLKKLEAIQFHERYKVDIEKKELINKTE